ncbi:MAG: hypothetical protein HQL63_02670 [Magnetococcales bacterium]|nr:hypothetical protein [Magnetococcales bacterium]MBF0322794.1 hypothetical protein [Magnetococcales bacterium]
MKTSVNGDVKSSLGTCRSVTVTSISEIGWHDTDIILPDIEAAGGPGADQWEASWHADNAAGSASLIEVGSLDGRKHRFLLDCGWHEGYMRSRFAAAGVDGMLELSIYGLYGGLHIAPFGPLTPQQEEAIVDLQRFGFLRIVPNHCTGLPAVRKMIELGYPVLRGSGQVGSVPPLMAGHGDRVVFGS